MSLKSDKYYVERLGNSNYSVWAFGAKAVLIKQKEWSAIEYKDGNGPTDEKDKEALATITMLVESQHYSLLQSCSTAKEAWTALAKAYSTQGNAGRMRLLRELFDSKLGEGAEKMMAYVTGVRGRVQKLRDIDGKEAVSEPMAVMFLLNGLSTAYDTHRTIIMTADKAMSFEDTVSALLQAEAQLKQESAAEGWPPTAMMSRVSGSPAVCWECGGTGHFKHNCPKWLAKQKVEDITLNSKQGRPQANMAVAGMDVYRGGGADLTVAECASFMTPGQFEIWYDNYRNGE